MIAGWTIDMTISWGVRMIPSRLRLVMPRMSRTASLRVSGTAWAAGCLTATVVIALLLMSALPGPRRCLGLARW